MEVFYRKRFLKDLKRLKNQPVYNKIHRLAFDLLPKVKTLNELSDIKSMSGYLNRYRIRIGNYRIGIEMKGDTLEIKRALHRHEFYRYFP
jgi:mRNA interferase RelE/StbE